MCESVELRSNIFQQLKIVCDKLISNLNHENIRDLSRVINAVPAEEFVNFTEYVLFPIQLHLLKHNASKTRTQTNSLHELIQCLHLVLERSTLDKVDKFVSLNGVLLQLIMDNEKMELSTHISEDLKYEVTRCVRCLYEGLDRDDDMLKSLYNCEKKLNIHSQAVYACTQIAKVEKMIKLRTEALQCLLTIMRVHGNDYAVKVPADDSTNYTWHVAEIVASMFPGIISSCYVILMSNSILNRNIYVFCIRVFCRSLTLLFPEAGEEMDSTIQLESRFKELILNRKNTSEKTQKLSPARTVRSDSWLTSVSEKLSSLIHCLAPLCNNQNPKVRRELVSGVGLMLRSCRFVESIRRPLLHVLVILSLDQAEEVSVEANAALKFVLDSPNSRANEFLQDLEESFFQSLDSVCSAMNSAHENVLVSQLNLLNGLLQILNLKRMLKSPIHLERLLDALINLVRFDAASLSTFSEQKIQDLRETNDSDLVSYVSWRNMKFLSYETENIIKNIFVTISQKVDLENLAYHFLDMIATDLGDRKEIIHLVNNIILCEHLRSYEERFRVIKAVLDVYLDPEYWSPSIQVTDKNRSLSLALLRNNLLLVCLLIEGIGNMAYCLQGNFKPLLIHCLYLLVERAGCANKFLSAVGITSLQKITQACGYNDILELMSDNVDFIMHRATLMLRHLEPNSKVFDVFCVIIAYSRKDASVVLCNVIESLLERDDIVQDVYSTGFLRVFAMFIRRLRCWFVSTVDDDCSLNESDDKLSEMLAKLCAFYADREETSHIRQWSMCAAKDELVDLEEIFRPTEYDLLNKMDEESNEDDIESPLNLEHFENEAVQPPVEDEIEQPRKEIPQHIKLVIAIAEKILHILPHRNTLNKILIIEILIDSVLLLFDHGEDELLPIIHKIWSPLVNRFEYDKSEALLMRRCFELLCVMAITAKDFIKSRVLKSVQPAINTFLVDAAKDSRLKDRKSVYRMSQRYKLQLTLLRQLGFLTLHLNYEEKEIHDVLVATTSYLSSKQPLPLQETCMDLFGLIEFEYRDFVRIYLLSLCTSRSTFTSPNVDEFRSITLKGTDDSAAIEYQKNVLKLLENKLPDCWRRLDTIET